MQSRKALGLADNAFVVGHVGRFHPLKNHSFLVDVFAEIYKRNKNAVLLLIGDGERKAEIETKVQKLGLAQAVLFLGVRSDVNLLMQAMDVFVFPSRYEGLGVSLIEAQAAGLPCVISDAIPQEVGVVDYLIKRVSLEKDVIEWAEAVLGCPQQERVNTTERITQKGFSIQQTAKKLQDFYLQEYYNVLTLPADLKGR
ncbi:MAG: glycosyltransferase family 1 protein [Thermoanaerobacteraceae bacterium]|nr:glycosyltransferase family 1 protein [Thermoanaerobacteraceae bacterium]